MPTSPNLVDLRVPPNEIWKRCYRSRLQPCSMTYSVPLHTCWCPPRCPSTLNSVKLPLQLAASYYPILFMLNDMKWLLKCGILFHSLIYQFYWQSRTVHCIIRIHVVAVTRISMVYLNPYPEVRVCEEDSSQVHVQQNIWLIYSTFACSQPYPLMLQERRDRMWSGIPNYVCLRFH
jgi:hypothetical protein